jgi:acyl carrier protein
MGQVDEKVGSLLADVLQIPAAGITEDMAMKDVEAWDSLKHMELIVSLEQSFGIELTFDEIVAMQSVGEIKRVLRERGAVS